MLLQCDRCDRAATRVAKGPSLFLLSLALAACSLPALGVTINLTGVVHSGSAPPATSTKQGYPPAVVGAGRAPPTPANRSIWVDREAAGPTPAGPSSGGGVAPAPATFRCAVTVTTEQQQSALADAVITCNGPPQTRPGVGPPGLTHPHQSFRFRVVARGTGAVVSPEHGGAPAPIIWDLFVLQQTSSDIISSIEGGSTTNTVSPVFLGVSETGSHLLRGFSGSSKMSEISLHNLSASITTSSSGFEFKGAPTSNLARLSAEALLKPKAVEYTGKRWIIFRGRLCWALCEFTRPLFISSQGRKIFNVFGTRLFTRFFSHGCL